MIGERKHIKPFLRWAGGKNWLVKHLGELIPKEGFKNYHEPFLGGGSIFFFLEPSNISFLSDLNKDLIETYICIKDNPEDVIKVLKTYKKNAEFYYEIRNKEFEDPIKKAARFIFLNQTSYNGIYRVNLKGQYNVPFAERQKNFLEPDNLRAASILLNDAILYHADFERLKHYIKKHDLIFLDPPYTVSHNKNGFIKYNQKLFSLEDQERLSQLIDYIKRKDAYYILTNAAHKTIEEIFDKGDKIFELSRANLIGGNNAIRGKTTEYIFTNTNLNL